MRARSHNREPKPDGPFVRVRLDMPGRDGKNSSRPEPESAKWPRKAKRLIVLLLRRAPPAPPTRTARLKPRLRRVQMRVARSNAASKAARFTAASPVYHSANPIHALGPRFHEPPRVPPRSTAASCEHSAGRKLRRGKGERGEPVQFHFHPAGAIYVSGRIGLTKCRPWSVEPEWGGSAATTRTARWVRIEPTGRREVT